MGASPHLLLLPCLAAAALLLLCASPSLHIPSPTSFIQHPIDIDPSLSQHFLVHPPLYDGIPNSSPVPPPHPTSSAENFKGLTEIMSELRRTGSSPASRRPQRNHSRTCDGRRVFIHRLPDRFNAGLLRRCREILPWFDMCDYFTNAGMGKVITKRKMRWPRPWRLGGEGNGDLEAETWKTLDDGETPPLLVPQERWYRTHQYALEIIFHERLERYECLTSDSDAANLFYVPYYAGIDILRWHFASNATDGERDALPLELSEWLSKSAAWRRNGGADHVLVLGKITWDFRRRTRVAGATTAAGEWGNHLMLLPEILSMNRVLIERDPWDGNEAGVPHPTFFHPESDGDVWAWQAMVAGFERRYVVSFAGMPRPNQSESIRSHLIRQCLQASSAGNSENSTGSAACFFLRCSGSTCLFPESTIHLFSHSEFCLQPPGDSPTRRSIFDALIAGCIPVLFDPFSVYYQYPWHLPEETRSYSVYIPAEKVRRGEVEVVSELGRISSRRRREMRRRIIYDIIPGLLYASPESHLSEVDDAFRITLKSLFSRISHRLKSGKN